MVVWVVCVRDIRDCWFDYARELSANLHGFRFTVICFILMYTFISDRFFNVLLYFQCLLIDYFTFFLLYTNAICTLFLFFLQENLVFVFVVVFFFILRADVILFFVFSFFFCLLFLI